MAINSNIAPYLSKLLSSVTPLLSNILSGKDITSGNVGSIGGAAGSSLGSALGKSGTSGNILGSFFGGQGGSTLGNVLGGKDISSSLYGNDALGSAFSNLGNILPGLLKNVNPATSYIGSNLGGLGGQAITGTGLFSNATQAAVNQGASTLADVAGAGVKATAPWGSIFSGQSDWTNPYSGYVESIGNIIPGLGTVLGGFLEGIIGKGQPGPKDVPEFNVAYESGTNRAKQMAAQGMTPYEIDKWARENGYVLYGGNNQEVGTVSAVLTPQEAITIDKVKSGMRGSYGLSPQYDPQKGYYWEQNTPVYTDPMYGGSYYQTEQREYFPTVEELLANTSFTAAMSQGYLGSYLEGAPKEIRQYASYVDPMYGGGYYYNPADTAKAAETQKYQETLAGQVAQEKKLPSYYADPMYGGGYYFDYTGKGISSEEYNKQMKAAGYDPDSSLSTKEQILLNL